MNRKWLIAGIGIIISVVLLWVAFRNLHPAQVWASIKEANLPLLALAALWFFVSTVVIALRWQYLLNAIVHVPLRDLFVLVCVGYAGNNVYPFRTGELLRIWLLRRNFQVPFARGTTTVLIERVFDGLVMLTFIIIPLLALDISSPEVRNLTAVAAPIFLSAVVMFFVLAARPHWLRNMVSTFSRILPDRLREPMMGLADEIVSGLEGLRSPADLAGAVLSSYGTWVLQIGVYWLVAQAFNLEANLMTLVLVVGVVNLAGLVPASPGQFGVFETFASAVLVATGVSPVMAVAFALTVHMVIWLPVTLAGMVFLLQQGLGLSAFARVQQLEETKAIS